MYVVNVQIDYHVQIWKEGTQCIAHAMPLDVASAGSTPQAAREALEEAVRLFLDTAAARGTLDEVLEEAGYQRQEGESWQGPEWIANEYHGVLGGV